MVERRTEDSLTFVAEDSTFRLIQAKTTSSSGSVRDDFRYGYDAVGNRTSETVRENGLLGASDVTTTSSFNAADQLSARGEVTYRRLAAEVLDGNTTRAAKSRPRRLGDPGKIVCTLGSNQTILYARVPILIRSRTIPTYEFPSVSDRFRCRSFGI